MTQERKAQLIERESRARISSEFNKAPVHVYMMLDPMGTISMPIIGCSISPAFIDLRKPQGYRFRLLRTYLHGQRIR